MTDHVNDTEQYFSLEVPHKTETTDGTSYLRLGNRPAPDDAQVKVEEGDEDILGDLGVLGNTPSWPRYNA